MEAISLIAKNLKKLRKERNLSLGELSKKYRNYELYPEDSLSFDASLPHRYENNGEKTVEATVVNLYPG